MYSGISFNCYGYFYSFQTILHTLKQIFLSEIGQIGQIAKALKFIFTQQNVRLEQEIIKYLVIDF